MPTGKGLSINQNSSTSPTIAEMTRRFLASVSSSGFRTQRRRKSREFHQPTLTRRRAGRIRWRYCLLQGRYGWTLATERCYVLRIAISLSNFCVNGLSHGGGQRRRRKTMGMHELSSERRRGFTPLASKQV